MKNKGIIVLGIILIGMTGCGKEDILVGKWETKYELGMYGEVNQIYEFEKSGKCKKIIYTDMKIEKECKYKKKEKEIEITFETGEKSILKYRVEGEDVVINGYLYKKQKSPRTPLCPKGLYFSIF